MDALGLHVCMYVYKGHTKVWLHALILLPDCTPGVFLRCFNGLIIKVYKNRISRIGKGAILVALSSQSAAAWANGWSRPASLGPANPGTWDHEANGSLLYGSEGTLMHLCHGAGA